MIVLDTHAWVWWAADDAALSAGARSAIRSARGLGVCTISLWEVAMLVARGRLRFDRDVLAWLEQALALPRVELLPVTPEIAVVATRLAPGFPEDPADRIIAATALCHRAPLVTKDAQLRRHRELGTCW
ncbi:MAG: type II toxin-antitoxin system VapC family toxin [Myxococcota bacterium]|nr:type II toxin-antitoxin system VapC family toxin [Myxococcota bacterium]